MVQAQALTKTYRMGTEVVRALDGVDLTIDKGELIAIVGTSGSGKSTLMNLLGCLDTPSSGSYRLAGLPVDQLDDEQLAEVRNRHIGFVFQSFHLLPRQSALDNVVLPLVYRRTDPLSPAERKRRAREVLEKVGLGDRMLHKPPELSGGQRQRVAIARALVNDPALLFADEPTGNLDSKTSEEILALLVTLNREHGRTVIVVTHEPDVARRCDRTVQLKDGRVVHDTRAERTAVTPAPGAP
ncbi:MAG: ABC transporter ATP-binding protein [Deltaproteobacteria bacterium]|nr:ABC transporter ATP-binding protein [Deltaproteobacteria bacterium]